MKIVKALKKCKSIAYCIVHYTYVNRNSNVKFVNFFPGFSLEYLGIYNLIKERCVIPDDKRITFFSCFDYRCIAPLFYGDINIFDTSENLKCRFTKYSDHMLGDDRIDLAFGFDYEESERYLRVPMWLRYRTEIFCKSDKEIAGYIARMRYPATLYSDRPKFCSLVASHDRWNSRTLISDQLSEIYGPIDFPGAFRHNDDTLKEVYGDVKCEYLKQYRFNLCPENTNAYGYVTEKIYEAITSGCVPIYWGSDNCPEPEVLNHDAIIFFKPDSDNKEALSLIRDLESNPKLYDEFARQPRFVPGAEDYFISSVHKLTDRMNELLRR